MYVCISMCMYICIYIYICVCVYIYIYKTREKMLSMPRLDDWGVATMCQTPQLFKDNLCCVETSATGSTLPNISAYAMSLVAHSVQGSTSQKRSDLADICSGWQGSILDHSILAEPPRCGLLCRRCVSSQMVPCTVQPCAVGCCSAR